MSGERLTATEMLGRLVGFDTTSSNSNLALIDAIADYLAGHGVASRRIFDTDGGKANLFATLGPDRAGGVALSGHTDVVPVAGQDWDSDPFTTVEADGRVYGRGTADMKGFIAAVLALVPDFLAADLETPIHLAFSFDEEVGCIGVRRLIEAIEAELPKPELVIVGEPTGMKVAAAHKGIHGFATTVTGREGHSSAPHRGVNAISHAAELIAYLDGLGAEMRGRADPASGFEPPYTTIQVGMIEGGTAANIIPKECRFRWEYRAMPGSDENEIADRFNRHAEESVAPKMQSVWPQAGIATRRIAVVPPLIAETNSPAEALARRLTGANSSGVVSFGTEAGLFQRADIPAVVCGPGSVDQAHQPNEFIETAQLDACTAFLHRLKDWAAAAPSP